MELQPVTIMMLLSSLNWDIELSPVNVDFELVRINMLLSVDIELLPIDLETKLPSDIDVELPPIDNCIELLPIKIDI